MPRALYSLNLEKDAMATSAYGVHVYTAYTDTVPEKMVDTPRFLDLRFGLYSPNHLG